MSYSPKYGEYNQPTYLLPFQPLDSLPKKYNRDREAAYEIVKKLFHEHNKLHAYSPYPCSRRDLCILSNLHIASSDRINKQIYKALYPIFKWDWDFIMQNNNIPKRERQQLNKIMALEELFLEEITHPLILSKILIKASGADFTS